MQEEKGKGLREQKQASWRSMIQSTGSALLWVLILLVLGGLYLAVNTKAASAGRVYLNLEEQVENARQKNSHLVAQLADVASPERMTELAESMGFRPATLRDIRFVDIDESPQKMDFRAPSPQASFQISLITVSPAYTETLLDAIQRWFRFGGVE
ncbi:MAG: hypothetical protein A2Z14_05070 [Chloroflexi bacterium RBG_16_48_8]|nr:MAG: hypothetical protein A2Z14_05070 [Chloroflexi bacterium RBG_16_48_8]